MIPGHYFGALFGFEPVQPTEWARLTVLHYGLKSIISVFSYNTEGLEPSFTTMVSTGFEPVILRT